MSNQICPSIVFKFTVVGVKDDEEEEEEPEADELKEERELLKPTVALISPLTAITANWSLTITDCRTTLAGAFEV
jgi:hypothetical protein